MLCNRPGPGSTAQTGKEQWPWGEPCSSISMQGTLKAATALQHEGLLVLPGSPAYQDWGRNLRLRRESTRCV